MRYIDTDVWIHSFVLQDKTKHLQANLIIEEVALENACTISCLTLQEIVFVLGKLKMENDEIVEITRQLLNIHPLPCTANELERAIILAKKIGFQHINDCIHTAIAEQFCDELITYNKKVFSKIAPLTKLNIRILEEFLLKGI